MVGIALAKELGIQVPDGLEGMHADVMQHPLQHEVIRQVVPPVDMRAAGTNHFSWILSVLHRVYHV